MAYAVKEIFYTLQGEGASTGRAAVFCRFPGCNLWKRSGAGSQHGGVHLLRYRSPVLQLPLSSPRGPRARRERQELGPGARVVAERAE